MYVFLNKFLRSKYFDSLPKFFARKIFKMFKIFFVETELKSLPQNNHPTTVDENQLKIMKNVEDNFYKPFRDPYKESNSSKYAHVLKGL